MFFKIPKILAALTLLTDTTRQQTITSSPSVPDWGFPGGTTTLSYISDGTSHITSI